VRTVATDRVDVILVPVEELLREHRLIGLPETVGAGHDLFVGGANLFR
jgi:hypothetical protein